MASRHHRRAPRGFTIIEILVAVGITAFGFAAIFSMQIGSMQGNISARETTIAVNLAESFSESLRWEAFAWDGTTFVEGSLISGPLGQWRTVTPEPVNHNGEADQPFSKFCVHYRLDALPAGYAGALNARVRVVWARASLDPTELDEICPQAAAENLDLDLGRFYSISVPVTLRANSEGA